VSAPVEKRHREALMDALEVPPCLARTNYIEHSRTPLLGDYSRWPRLSQAIADAEASAKPRWIPVEEALPTFGERVLFANSDGVSYGFLSEADGWFHEQTDGYNDYLDAFGVTRWQPLPESPSMPVRELEPVRDEPAADEHE